MLLVKRTLQIELVSALSALFTLQRQAMVQDLERTRQANQLPEAQLPGTALLPTQFFLEPTAAAISLPTICAKVGEKSATGH